MIDLHDTYGRRLLFQPDAIAVIREAGASQAWHGIRANLQTTDGSWWEVQESPEQITTLLAEIDT